MIRKSQSVSADGDGPAAPELNRFLRMGRRRILLRRLLWIALASALFNTALVLGMWLANRFFDLHLPILTPGLYIFAVFAVLTFVKIGPTQVAERLDQRMKLKDRLLTFLDFSRRVDIEPAFRTAQSDEATEATRKVNLRRGLPIHPLLWAGPLLFLWMVVLNYFSPFLPTPLRLMQSLVGEFHPGGPVVSSPDAGGPEEASQEADIRTPGGEVEPPADVSETASREQTAAGGGRGKKPLHEIDENGERPHFGNEDGKLPPEDLAEQFRSTGGIPARFGEPSMLFSETVGKELSAVEEGASPESRQKVSPDTLPPPQGKISFNLIPASAQEGGEKKGERLQITVDFDTVPAQYREYVRRYFGRLQRHGGGGESGS